jgi:hypothetical protein
VIGPWENRINFPFPISVHHRFPEGLKAGPSGKSRPSVKIETFNIGLLVGFCLFSSGRFIDLQAFKKLPAKTYLLIFRKERREMDLTINW